jgi:hypothetical protein
MMMQPSTAMPPTIYMPPDNLDFAWDRPETDASLRAKLATGSGYDWIYTAAWLMREAKVEQVWQYLNLKIIADNFPLLRPLLGRRQAVWDHLLQAAHELGRI